jgi:hypothetical protein
MAGWWFSLVSGPLYRLVLYRWIWIIVMWAMFLWNVMSLRLNLVATHPDRAAGLGFLVETQRVFSFIGFAAASVISSRFMNQVAYEGKTLGDLKLLMIGAILLIVICTSAPLLMLAPRLHHVRLRGVFEYGALGTTYVRQFDSKWIHANPGKAEGLLGSSDIQSLADISNSFGVVRDMKVILLNKEMLTGLALPAVIPMLVFVLAVSPAEEVVRAILKLIG